MCLLADVQVNNVTFSFSICSQSSPKTHPRPSLPRTHTHTHTHLAHREFEQTVSKRQKRPSDNVAVCVPSLALSLCSAVCRCLVSNTHTYTHTHHSLHLLEPTCIIESVAQEAQTPRCCLVFKCKFSTFSLLQQEYKDSLCKHHELNSKVKLDQL